MHAARRRPSKFQVGTPRRRRPAIPAGSQAGDGLRSKMVGSARRSGPKLQARSAVSGSRFSSGAFPHRGGCAAKVGPLGEPSLPWWTDAPQKFPLPSLERSRLHRIFPEREYFEFVGAACRLFSRTGIFFRVLPSLERKMAGLSEKN
jgi:hypothetical protein